jgi:hypothetical protein
MDGMWWLRVKTSLGENGLRISDGIGKVLKNKLSLPSMI